MNAAPDLLRIDGITKRFGALVANDGISLALQRGEVPSLATSAPKRLVMPSIRSRSGAAFTWP